MRVKVVLVGGGTGGHFYPLMSIAEAVQRTGAHVELFYFGPEPYDSEALRARGITYVSCPAGKWRKYFSLHNALDLLKTAVGIFVAASKLFFLYPDVVVSKGGYTSVPVVLAAWFLRIPIIVHESDAVPGSANILGSRFARYVAVSYENAKTYFPEDKTVLTGIPIRNELLVPPRSNATTVFAIKSNLPIILILGGSQGAERVNALILESLDELLPRYEIIHQTGAVHFDITTLTANEFITDPELLARYHPVPFLSAQDLNDALHLATIIISRAGSGSIHEIAVHGKPSILIPIPETISHDQRTNAYTYARAGAAIVIEEQNLKDGLLVPEIDRIMQDQSAYATLQQGALAFGNPNAAIDIARMITLIAEEH